MYLYRINATLLTFDDGYIDHYTYIFPILDKYKIQGTFYIPGKTFREHILLDVNKIHFIPASAPADLLLQDLISEIKANKEEYNLEDSESLFNKYAVEYPFDKKETIFIKRMLQMVLSEQLRNKISTKLFEKYIGSYFSHPRQ